MKKLPLLIVIMAVPALLVIAQERKVTARESVATAQVKEVVVPKGKTYVKLDAKGKEIARFKSGQTMARTIDCAQVPCPSTFGKDVVCWKCKERPEGTAPKATTRY